MPGTIGGNTIVAMLGGTMEINGFIGGTTQVLGGSSTGGQDEFMLETINPSFSVSNLGIVSWSYNTGLGITDLSVTYTNGQDIGTVSRTTTRTQNISFTAPAGYSNTGDTISGSVTFNQSAVSAPDVDATGASSINPTFATLNGRVNSNGGAPIFESGFYILENGTSQANVITSGRYVFNSSSNISGNFSETESNLDQNRTYDT